MDSKCQEFGGSDEDADGEDEEIAAAMPTEFTEQYGHMRGAGAYQQALSGSLSYDPVLDPALSQDTATGAYASLSIYGDAAGDDVDQPQVPTDFQSTGSARLQSAVPEYAPGRSLNERPGLVQVGHSIQTAWGGPITPVASVPVASVSALVNTDQLAQQASGPAPNIDFASAYTSAQSSGAVVPPFAHPGSFAPPSPLASPTYDAAHAPPAPPVVASSPSNPAQGYQDPNDATNWIVAQPAKLKWTTKKKYMERNITVNGHRAVNSEQDIKCVTCESAGVGRACIKLVADPARVFPGNSTASAGSLKCSFCVGRNQKCVWPVANAS